eukprot:SAG31_NODE_5301_length_2621_cov_10.452022_5_plen_287_part_00
MEFLVVLRKLCQNCERVCNYFVCCAVIEKSSEHVHTRNVGLKKLFADEVLPLGIVAREKYQAVVAARAAARSERESRVRCKVVYEGGAVRFPLHVQLKKDQPHAVAHVQVVRAAAGMTSAVVGQLRFGDVVEIIEEEELLPEHSGPSGTQVISTEDTAASTPVQSENEVTTDEIEMPMTRDAVRRAHVIRRLQFHPELLKRIEGWVSLVARDGTVLLDLVTNEETSEEDDSDEDSPSESEEDSPSESEEDSQSESGEDNHSESEEDNHSESQQDKEVDDRSCDARA